MEAYVKDGEKSGSRVSIFGVASPAASTADYERNGL